MLPQTSHTHRGRDYFSAPWCYLIWGTPVVVMGADGAAYEHGLLSVTYFGTILVLAVSWIGIMCFVNGRSCGRVHCTIDGVAFPILSFIGALNVVGIVSFPWSWYSPAFLAILIGSFIPEFTWGRYFRKRGAKVAASESFSWR